MDALSVFIVISLGLLVALILLFTAYTRLKSDHYIIKTKYEALISRKK